MASSSSCSVSSPAMSTSMVSQRTTSIGRNSSRAAPIVVNVHQVHAPRARLVGVTPLGIAGIDHRGAFLPQHLPGVDVAQRPIVKACIGKVRDGAGGVGVVVEVATHVGVKQTDAETAARRRVGKEGRQVLTHLAPG